MVRHSGESSVSMALAQTFTGWWTFAVLLTFYSCVVFLKFIYWFHNHPFFNYLQGFCKTVNSILRKKNGKKRPKMLQFSHWNFWYTCCFQGDISITKYSSWDQNRCRQHERNLVGDGGDMGDMSPPLFCPWGTDYVLSPPLFDPNLMVF